MQHRIRQALDDLNSLSQTMSGSERELVLQPVLIGLGATLPVGATSPLLMAPAPDRPSDNSGWSGGREADQTGKQGADLRDGEGQQVDFEVGRVLSPRWPPLARRSGRAGPAWRG